MLNNFFADPVTLFKGALAGLVFGFLLQKGGVTRYQVILGQFLMKNFIVLKVMLTAIIVGGMGIFALRAMGLEVALHIKNAALLGNVLGGLIFGVGMAILGFCPGTGVAALGDGARHAIPGVLGMLAGAALYAEVYPLMKSEILGIGDFGKVTLDAVTGLSPLWFIVFMAVVGILGFIGLERWEKHNA